LLKNWNAASEHMLSLGGGTQRGDGIRKRTTQRHFGHGAGQGVRRPKRGLAVGQHPESGTVTILPPEKKIVTEQLRSDTDS